MKTQTDLEAEMRDLVEQSLAQGQPVLATWITQTVVSLHQEIFGPDVDWHLCNSYENVRNTVRKITRLYKPQESATPEQMVLPGFKRLQIAYLVERNKEQVIIPTVQLTDLEIDTKILELESMAVGCRLHAEELRRYKSKRRKVA